jgi:2-polyprenyl-6-hydroxyphenyl methylase/3-demethylubiquinone-9 3-methyltransferase
MNTKNTQNVDAAEISRFESLSQDWWNLRGDFKALHDINPARVRYIDDRSAIRGKTVLDIGCGGGILSEAMAGMGASVTGIDQSEAALNTARRHLQTTGRNATFLHITAEALAATSSSCFDVVTCLEMLEHVPDPLSVIAAAHTLVKPGGDVFFATLNRNFKSFILAIVGAEYILRLMPIGTHTHGRFIRPPEMAQWIHTAGLDLQDMTGLHYNPFLRTCKLGGNLDVNYLVHARRLTEVKRLNNC